LIDDGGQVRFGFGEGEGTHDDAFVTI